MPDRPPPTLFAALCRRLGPPAALVSDAELLGRYARTGDPAAFELLVRRHGPRVFGRATVLPGNLLASIKGRPILFA